MRASRHFILSLAAVLCFGAVVAVADPRSDEAMAGLALSGIVDSRHVEVSVDAPVLAIALGEMPTADRRESDARDLTLPRLNQLPRACCGAAAEASSASGNAGWPSGNTLPSDDRLRLSRSLVIQHVRLQV